MLREWESIVNRVAKREVGEKMIVCAKSARWWDSEVKDKINSRRKFHVRWQGRYMGRLLAVEGGERF